MLSIKQLVDGPLDCCCCCCTFDPKYTTLLCPTKKLYIKPSKKCVFISIHEMLKNGTLFLAILQTLLYLICAYNIKSFIYEG